LPGATAAQAIVDRALPYLDSLSKESDDESVVHEDRWQNVAFDTSHVIRRCPARLRGRCGCLRGTLTLPETANGFDQEP